MKHRDTLVEVVDEPGSLGRIRVSSPPEIMIHSKRDSAHEPKHSRRVGYRELGLILNSVILLDH